MKHFASAICLLELFQTFRLSISFLHHSVFRKMSLIESKAEKRAKIYGAIFRVSPDYFLSQSTNILTTNIITQYSLISKALKLVKGVFSSFHFPNDLGLVFWRWQVLLITETKGSEVYKPLVRSYVSQGAIGRFHGETINNTFSLH